MYSSYTTLQRAQLAKQEYLDTQEVFLGVYAPGRNAALKASLQDQLHRKFLLTDSLRPEALGSAAGVLLVREDLFLMSTALSCFADALRSGADYVTSDAVFGYSGVTTLYHSQGFAACPGCALVSRELLRRCQAEARDPENPVELLTLAAKLSRSHVCLPLALAHYERDICAEDVWSVKGKRVFIMSHLLDMTGAPIVLVSAIPVLRSLGYEVVVLGPSDEGSLPLFLEAGAAVVTRRDCVTSSTLWELASSADFVLANTVVEAPAVSTLNGGFVPVLWWLHDAFAGYPFITHKIPKELADNVHIAAVGSHATAAMHSVRPKFKVEQLIYGLPDYARESFPRYDLSYAGGRPLFVTVGSMEMRKGQDIYCEAIRLLPPEVREKASFLFVGQAADKEMMDSVRALTADYPENVYYCKRLTRDEIKSLMEQCTGLVCASRDDPMPTFVTEGLIFGKPSIVSEHTGTAGLISEGRNGFVYHNDDPQQLAVLLEHAIEHPEELASMRTECRKMYEQYYSKEAFEQTLRAAVEDLTAKK